MCDDVVRSEYEARPSVGAHGKRAMIPRLFNALYMHGPLGTAWRICAAAQNRFGNIAICKHLCPFVQGALSNIQRSLDSRFDRSHGTDTSGVVPLNALDIKSKNIEEGIWYEPMSVKVFRQLMKALARDPQRYDFVDFGSGKGRVLLLASDYGFRRITGVEFAPELHEIAMRNVAVLERNAGGPGNVEALCMDATEYAIPNVPVVLFFYSPFTGSVMEQVIGNVLTSFAMQPREMVLLFYGSNPNSIDLLKATHWPCRELAIHADWSRFTNYRGFIFTSPAA